MTLQQGCGMAADGCNNAEKAGYSLIAVLKCRTMCKTLTFQSTRNNRINIAGDRRSILMPK